MDISKLDSNMKVETNLKLDDVAFYDVRREPFEVYGLYNYRNEPQFKRLPDEIGLNVNEGVKELYLNTSGGRVRFSTDSKYVAIKTVIPSFHLMSGMPLSGSTGFDLYVDDPETGDSRYRQTFMPPKTVTDGYESVITFRNRALRHFTIHFPSYGQVKDLYVGIQRDATLGEGMKYRDALPIVFYGSSITQGACSSRPGNIYENMISRAFRMDYLNLGFSGSGKAEDTIVDYMCTLPMSVFISDYDHNATSEEHLRSTHLKMYQKIRAAKPDVPYIMLSRPDYDNMPNLDGIINRRNIIYDTFLYAYEHGDRNVYYIDGASIFRGPYEDSCTVDNCHPNDLGFSMMADAIGAEIRRAFSQKKIYY